MNSGLHDKNSFIADSRGFTLIEVMIVVVIIAILAAIAYPSYQEQVRKSRRADCAGALTSLAAAMERHYTQFNTYCDAGTTAVGGCGGAGGDSGLPTIFATTCPLDGGTATYNLSIDGSGLPAPTVPISQNAFMVRATPIGPQANDRCGELTLTNTGARGIANADAGVAAQECW